MSEEFTPFPKPDVRSCRVVFFLTPQDHAVFTATAEKFGLTRSSLSTSIVERLLIGGFSPLVGAKLCYQLQARYAAKGHVAKISYFGIRPLPPLPDEEVPGLEIRPLLHEIEMGLKA
jgi:hypothetical protein